MITGDVLFPKGTFTSNSGTDCNFSSTEIRWVALYRQSSVSSDSAWLSDDFVKLFRHPLSEIVPGSNLDNIGAFLHSFHAPKYTSNVYHLEIITV